MTNDELESACTGNWFGEIPLAVCRLGKLSRDEDVQVKLEQTDWDLVVCDEAHKMSASFFGGAAKPCQVRQVRDVILKYKLAGEIR